MTSTVKNGVLVNGKGKRISPDGVKYNKLGRRISKPTGAIGKAVESKQSFATLKSVSSAAVARSMPIRTGRSMVKRPKPPRPLPNRAAFGAAAARAKPPANPKLPAKSARVSTVKTPQRTFGAVSTKRIMPKPATR